MVVQHSALIGDDNVLADFAIFGALADVIGAELFPVDTASKQLLKGLGGYLMIAIIQRCIKQILTLL